MEPAEVASAVRVNAAALVGLDWRPFDRTAMIRFRGQSGEPFAVRLDGVHLLATRQSMLGGWDYPPFGAESWEDWLVHHFDILSGGEFLERFLAQQLGLPSHIIVYSLNSAGLESPEFVRPVHVMLVTGG